MRRLAWRFLPPRIAAWRLAARLTLRISSRYSRKHEWRAQGRRGRQGSRYHAGWPGSRGDDRTAMGWQDQVCGKSGRSGLGQQERRPGFLASIGFAGSLCRSLFLGGRLNRRLGRRGMAWTSTLAIAHCMHRQIPPLGSDRADSLMSQMNAPIRMMPKDQHHDDKGRRRCRQRP
jgi:hypothetical protein